MKELHIEIYEEGDDRLFVDGRLTPIKGYTIDVEDLAPLFATLGVRVTVTQYRDDERLRHHTEGMNGEPGVEVYNSDKQP